jgi:hypothetical protein
VERETEVDIASVVEANIDSDRVTYINNIRTESKFYNVFRNNARMLLGQVRYRQIKEKIETIINSPSILYLAKLKQVDALLRSLMKNSVSFSVYDKKLLEGIYTKDIINCSTLDADQCESNKFCMQKQDGSCALIIPKKNLINETDNEVVYFGKLADELVRYNRIKSFIFQQSVFLSFTHVKYNLRDNEIILLQSLLTNDYFEGLTVAPTNKYIKNNTYDTAQPMKTQSYSNVLEPIEKSNTNDSNTNVIETKCDDPSSILVTSPYWKPLFPENSIEIIFHDKPALCTFDIFLIMLRNSKLSKHDLKETLVEEYAHYYNDYKFEIIQTLKLQGKHKIAKQLIYKKTTLPNIIMSEDYYATNIDLWLLAIHFDLPVIFFSGTELVENGKKLLVAHKSKGEEGSDNYYFIRTPGIKNDVANSYRLVAAPKYKDRIPLSVLKPSLAATIRESIVDNPLIQYFNSVSLLEATQRLKAKKVKLVAVSEEEQKAPAPAPEVLPVPAPAVLPAPTIIVGKKIKKKLVLID